MERCRHLPEGLRQRTHTEVLMRTGLCMISVTFFTVLLGGLISCKPASAGVTVIVNNASGSEITNLQVKFTGGSKSSTALKSAESFQTKVNPSGSSDLVVEFTDSTGIQHSGKVDVYFERNYSGSIQITIEPGGKVTWKDETKV